MISKNLVLTIKIGDFYSEIAKISHPMIEGYAKKIGADFLCITSTEFPVVGYAKFEIYNLLDTYDRIIYVDTDVIISPDTLNLFDIVPESKIGMVNERPLGYDGKFEEFLRIYGKRYLDKWKLHRNCYNSGVIVCSKCHKDLFSLPTRFIDHYSEQSFLNLRILECGAEIFQLSHQYNRLVYMDLVMKEHHLKSFIVHYAGFFANRSAEDCRNILEEEYSIMLNKDFSKSDLRLAWANVR